MPPPDREGAPQAGGKRKNTEPRAMCPPMSVTELAATEAIELMARYDTELVGTSSKSTTRIAAFTHHMTQATYCFDGVEADRKELRKSVACGEDHATLRADNAALIVRMKVATKTVKRSKALAEKYYDLCVASGVDAEVLNGVEEAEESDEEAEEHAEEMEEPDEEAD